jgi:hypothetical protein
MAILEGLRERSPVLGNSSLCVGCALLPPLFLARAQLVGLEPETFHHSQATGSENSRSAGLLRLSYQ